MDLFKMEVAQGWRGVIGKDGGYTAIRVERGVLLKKLSVRFSTKADDSLKSICRDTFRLDILLL